MIKAELDIFRINQIIANDSIIVLLLIKVKYENNAYKNIFNEIEYLNFAIFL